MLEADREIDLDCKIYDFHLTIPPSVMVPSSYTRLLFEGIPENVNFNKGLDLGCGCGLLALLLARRGCKKVLATDINPVAINATNLNAKLNNVGNVVCAVEANMFSGLPYDFDIIAFNPPSFPSLTSKKLRPNFYAGKDGRKFIDIAIKNAKHHLNPGGKFFYIQNSLSDFRKSIKMIESEGYKWKVLNSQKTEFREEYYTQIRHLRNLKLKGYCDYIEQGGKAFQEIHIMELQHE